MGARGTCAASFRLGSRISSTEPRPVIRTFKSSGWRASSTPAYFAACGVTEALEEQSHDFGRTLRVRAIRPLAEVHLKLAEVGDRLPAGERHRLAPLSSALAHFEVELCCLARMIDGETNHCL